MHSSSEDLPEERRTMSEHFYRGMMGVILLLVLYIDRPELYYVYVGQLLVEGITNWRIPLLLDRLRSRQIERSGRTVPQPRTNIAFDSERAMRLFFAALMILAFYALPSPYWFLNWIIAAFLILSGLVRVCPVVLFFRSVGFR